MGVVAEGEGAAAWPQMCRQNKLWRNGNAKRASVRRKARFIIFWDEPEWMNCYLMPAPTGGFL